MKPVDIHTFEKDLFRRKSPVKKLLKLSLKLFEARQIGVLYGTDHTKAKFLPTRVWDRGIMDRFDGRGLMGLFLKAFGKYVVTNRKLSPVYFFKKDRTGQIIDNDGVISHVLRNSSDYYKKGIRVIICTKSKTYIQPDEQKYVKVPYFSYDGNHIVCSEDKINADARIINQFNSKNSIYVYLPDYGILVINTASEELMEMEGLRFVQEEDLKSRLDILIRLVNTSSLAHLGLVPRKKRAQLLWQKERRLRKTSLELIENEKRYRELYENAPIAYISMNSKGWILKCNYKACALLGYNMQQLMGQNAQKLLWEKQGNENQLVHFLDRVVDGRITQAVEWQVIPRDGRPVWASISVEAIKDSRGEVVEFRVMLMDVSRRKTLKKQLLASHKMEAMGTLAGGIAHDFNNVLFLVSGYTEMLIMDMAKSDPEKKNLDVIMDCVRHANELVNQILIFSRQKKHEAKVLNLEDVIQKSMILIHSFLPSTIKVKIETDGSCGDIFADPIQIHQVIIHLVTNAYHAMEEKGGTLSVSLIKKVDVEPIFYQYPVQEKNYICLSIRDTGTGIDPDIIEKIFDPYFSTKKESNCSGVGLSVVQGIVESCGGHIKVDTVLQKGTCFRLYFPESHSHVIEKSLAPLNFSNHLAN